ncbi:hypothetical protein FOZ62_024437, partial [Perkinsus olseni]
WMYSFDKSDLFGALSELKLGAFVAAYGNVTLDELGTFHSAELPFVFKKFGEGPANLSSSVSSIVSLYMAHPPRQPGDPFHRISDAFSCMWTHMASHGSPTSPQQHCPGLSDGGVPSWLPYNSSLDGSQAQGVYMHIGDKLSMQAWRSNNIYPDNEMPSIEQCQWWDEHPVGFHDLRADIPITTTPPPTPTRPVSSARCWAAGNIILILISFVVLSLLA